MWCLKDCESLSSYSSAEKFFKGLEVWLLRPNVLDKRVLGAVVTAEGFLCPEWQRCLEHKDLSFRKFMERNRRDRSECLHVVKYLVRRLLPRRKQKHDEYELVIQDEMETSVVFLQLSLPSKANQGDHLSEALLVLPGVYKLVYSGGSGGSSGGGSGAEARLTSPQLALYLLEGLEAISLESVQRLALVPSADWLAAVLLPKLARWAVPTLEVAPGPGKGLSPVPLDRYLALYQELKERHSDHLVKHWPEGTDPLKFVYEDIAIATYLLLLWEQERKETGEDRKQSFLDLGCGNGLLVYLLSMEGHPGRGLDLRERRTWQMYRKCATLQVCTLTPSPTTVYPEDWLLGNHSDELTPWLPVIAARSSYSTRFFVLPCCPWDFNRKFHRRVGGVSQYHDYLDYIQEIGEVMGFKVHRDTLRIPSSKRVCLVGRQRMYSPHQELDIDALRQKFIDERCGSRSVHSEGDWVEGFSPRESVEAVRNCTQLARGLSDSIVNKVAFKLLETTSYVYCTICEKATDEVGPEDRACTLQDKVYPRQEPSSSLRVEGSSEKCGVGASLDDGINQAAKVNPGVLDIKCGSGVQQWNVGGKMTLSEVAAMFDKEVLQGLRKEFGGLQTLLRNQHQVFQVRKGTVCLWNWATEEGELAGTKSSSTSMKRCSSSLCSDKEQLVKTKPCWFFHHHPQGCPRTSHYCPYAHGLADSRPRPNFKAIKNCIT